ncbi:hypothetical protein GF327_09730 [Candidatus Woesearchaeota archaeon]|nr:hypothetical protein [Candidatus Woesearchaeota archaeon]
MKHYTKEQLIHYLNTLSKKIRKTPTTKQMDKHKKYPCSSTYRKRFGSWNSALKKAGFKPNKIKRYSKKELIDSLKQLHKDLGKIPKTTDLKNRKWIASYSTYRKYFRTWKNALKKAGIKKKDFSYLQRYIDP